jgi:hypothetical protein
VITHEHREENRLAPLQQYNPILIESRKNVSIVEKINTFKSEGIFLFQQYLHEGRWLVLLSKRP